MKKYSILNDLRPADVVLILLILLAIIFSARYYLSNKPHSQVYIYKDNQLFGIYSLEKDKIIKIDVHNTVEIKNGKVRMKFSDCPDKRCVKQGFTKSMPIICLPRKVVIEINDDGKQKKLILQ
ncbi:MAG TPA: NusG domain II-containing protein [Candidatus Cloacimonas sp.]|nr:NusG domain II-containing protein [Candidatus Cloacimonas sp.]HQC31408.1 NusG domain II-containing protein [Candidatus Cloacimonas sp.]